jgi:hypothetical protein
MLVPILGEITTLTRVALCTLVYMRPTIPWILLWWMMIEMMFASTSAQQIHGFLNSTSHRKFYIQDGLAKVGSSLLICVLINIPRYNIRRTRRYVLPVDKRRETKSPAWAAERVQSLSITCSKFIWLMVNTRLTLIRKMCEWPRNTRLTLIRKMCEWPRKPVPKNPPR